MFILAIIKRITSVSIIVSLCLFYLSPVFAQDARVWTTANDFNENDYIRIFAADLDPSAKCEQYLITPKGQEIYDGSSGGGCKRWGFPAEFKLRNNYGNWKVKYLVFKDDTL